MSLPVDNLISNLEGRGLTARRAGDGWTAQCPAHDDRQASLSISVGDDDRALVCCHAGCSTDDILRSLGIERRDLFAERDRPDTLARPNPARKPAPLPTDDELRGWAQQLVSNDRLLDRLRELRRWSAEALASLGVGFDGDRLVFPIRDASGQLVNVCRYTPSPKDGERKMLARAGRPRDLFPAPETLTGNEAWIVEGEPDAVAATTLGLPAVALPGVEAAKRLDVERFRRFRRVHVALDCDRQGREAAERIAAAFVAAGIEVRVVDLEPSRDDGYDLSDLVREAAQDGAEGLKHARRFLDRMAAGVKPHVTASAGSSTVAPATRSRAQASWPSPLDAAALHGLAGEIVNTIAPHTEADPAAILASFLAGFGNVIGRGPGWRHGGTFHATNLYVLLVGATSSGRKGTAGDEALRVLRMADPDWNARRVVGGLSTGEGVVHQVRDPISKRRKAKNPSEEADADGMVEEVEDPGEPDKRLFVIEAEFAQALKVMQREGNTLSPIIRKLWDSGRAGSLTKSPYRTTAALVSIVGHISKHELCRRLDDTEIANGFANRFLVVCSRRSKSLPFGGDLRDEDLAGLADRLRSVIELSRKRGELDMDAQARRLWVSLYEQLTRDRPGIFGAICGRAAPIVRRLAVLYALLDGDALVREPHLMAAAAVWRHSEESALVVFGDKLGHRLADKLRPWLRDAGTEGLTREQIRERLGGRTSASEIEDALTVLAESGLAEQSRRATRGRPQERWVSLERVEETEETPSDTAPEDFPTFPPRSTLELADAA